MITAQVIRGGLAALAAVCLCGAARADHGYGYLRAPGRPAEPYAPRPGDLVFYTHDSRTFRVLYALARSGSPYHVAVVVALPDGDLATLEAGPYDLINIVLLGLGPRLRSHNGTIWVRRLRAPLRPEQSQRLTAFALDATTKRYALARVVKEATPLCAHGGRLRARLFGSAALDKSHWFCSELTAAAACVVGLLDAKAVRPSSVYPRDLFVDRPHDLSRTWEPPARWSAGP